MNFGTIVHKFVSEKEKALSLLESKRIESIKRRRKRMLASVLCVFCGIVFFIGASLLIPFPISIFVSVALVFIAIACCCYFFKETNEYAGDYTATVTKPLLSMAYGGLTVSQTSYGEADYHACAFYKRSYDRFNSKQSVHGKLHGRDFRLTEVHAEEKKRYQDSNGRTKTRWVTLFKGVILHLDYHKNIKANVLVQPDTAERLLGRFGRKLQGMNRDLIHLENEEFEKTFKVLSEDAVAAHHAFSPDMQERFLRFIKKFKQTPTARIWNSRFYMAFPKEDCRFQPNISVHPSSQDQMLQILHAIHRYASITEELKMR